MSIIDEFVHPSVIAILLGLLGAGWRRWMGEETGTPRWLHLLAAFALMFAAAGYMSRDPWLALTAGGMFAAGVSFGHTFEPWGPLVWRYGLMTMLMTIAMGLQGAPEAAPYGLAGMLSPIGYLVGKRLRLSCWTCLGEAWLGFVWLAPLPLCRLVAGVL